MLLRNSRRIFARTSNKSVGGSTTAKKPVDLEHEKLKEMVKLNTNLKEINSNLSFMYFAQILIGLNIAFSNIIAIP